MQKQDDFQPQNQVKVPQMQKRSPGPWGQRLGAVMGAVALTVFGSRRALQERAQEQRPLGEMQATERWMEQGFTLH